MNTTFLPEEIIYKAEEQWIAEKISELSGGKFKVPKSRKKSYHKEFLHIIEKNDWNKINFHFELYWYNGGPLSKADKINVFAHLETQFIDKELNKKVRKKFNFYDGNTLEKEIIFPDFSSESKATETIRHIVEILNTEKFQKYAGIADECLKELF
ncbi:MAG: hypothetical protein SPE43_04610 [Ruminococcus sp.]|nr:hypothetical protein [Ruminococcus sp.]